MKTILLATHETTTLQLLIEVKEERASASYFLNGIEVIEWAKIKPIYQLFFSSMLDTYCIENNLIKWQY